jgi:RNA polymerase sigma factor (sigma-70 family)
MRHAAAHMPRDEAIEVAHQVAASFVERSTGPTEQATEAVRSMDAFIHRAVLNRIRDLWRASRRRLGAEQVWNGERGDIAPVWAGPHAALESEELQTLIADTVAAMPERVRAVFLLIRDEQLSYKAAAERLGIGVGTVHTHLSRANAMLRQAVDSYLHTPETKRAARLLNNQRVGRT